MVAMTMITARRPVPVVGAAIVHLQVAARVLAAPAMVGRIRRLQVASMGSVPRCPIACARRPIGRVRRAPNRPRPGRSGSRSRGRRPRQQCQGSLTFAIGRAAAGAERLHRRECPRKLAALTGCVVL